MKINNVSEFKLSSLDFYLPDMTKSQKHKLSFIINEVEVKEEDDDYNNNNLILRYSKDLSDCINAIPDLL